MRDGKPIVIFECKSAQQDLDSTHASQLFRYFTVTDARVGVLTNGVVYRFFSDLEAPNKMDERPFLELDMREVQESLVAELKKLSKGTFNIDGLIEAAGELKYTRAIKQYLANQIADPDEDLVKLLVGKVYSGRFTQSVREQFTSIVKRALTGYIADRVNDRLKSALEVESSELKQEGPAQSDSTAEHRNQSFELPEGVAFIDEERGIQTTDDELNGFRIVKAIASEFVEPERVVHRDTKSYLGILLDDNNRKPICRLHFNTAQKYLGVFLEDKNEERIPIDRVEEIYKYREYIKRIISHYEAG